MANPGTKDSKPTANKPVASNNIVPMSRRATSKARNNIVSTRGGLTPGGQEAALAAYESKLAQRRGMAATKNNIVFGPRSSVGNRLAARAQKGVKGLRALEGAAKKLEKRVVTGKVSKKETAAMKRGKGANTVREASVAARIGANAFKGDAKQQQKKAYYAARAYGRLAKRAAAMGDKKQAAYYRQLKSEMTDQKNFLNNVIPPKERYRPRNKQTKKGKK